MEMLEQIGNVANQVKTKAVSAAQVAKNNAVKVLTNGALSTAAATSLMNPAIAVVVDGASEANRMNAQNLAVPSQLVTPGEGKLGNVGNYDYLDRIAEVLVAYGACGDDYDAVAEFFSVVKKIGVRNIPYSYIAHSSGSRFSDNSKGVNVTICGNRGLLSRWKMTISSPDFMGGMSTTTLDVLLFKANNGSFIKHHDIFGNNHSISIDGRSIKLSNPVRY